MHRLALGLLLAASALAGPTPVPAQDADPFPTPPELESAVGFWTQVYSRWGLGQAAIHDAEHLGLVYEVVDLPGEPGQTLSESQKLFLQDRVRLWQVQLGDLAARTAAGAALSPSEQELALKILESAGTDALPGAAARVRSQKGVRERFRRGLEIAGRYDGLFREIFREQGLPEDLAFLPHVESSFQAAARSSAGAVGIWQFTRGTGRLFLRINGAVDERLDPVASARGAARYLKKAHRDLGSWPLALTSYNHGIAGMARARSVFGHDFVRIVREYDAPTFGFASRNFYAEFLAARRIASDPLAHFPEGVAPEPPLDHRAVVLDKAAKASSLSRTFGVDAASLRRANPAWTARAARGTVLLPAGTTVWVPGGTAVVRQEPRRSSAEPARAHVVRKGDTLFAIAARYGVTLADLLLENGITDPRSLRPGQRLVLPR